MDASKNKESDIPTKKRESAPIAAQAPSTSGVLLREAKIYRYGNLVMDRDMTFDGDLIVGGSISGKNGKKYALVVKGNIDAFGDIDVGIINARNIDAHAQSIYAATIDALDVETQDINALILNARNIDARNIDALTINARNIDAVGNIKTRTINARNIYAQDIDAGNIDASFIVCETYEQKEGAKLVCRNIIKNKSTYAKKEVTTDEEHKNMGTASVAKPVLYGIMISVAVGAICLDVMSFYSDIASKLKKINSNVKAETAAIQNQTIMMKRQNAILFSMLRQHGTLSAPALRLKPRKQQ